uniref:Uncharacterized protein n=1 Tax=Ditylenchus dipsaci TaxID=166011 RepID=A0A915D755_9BILA
MCCFFLIQVFIVLVVIAILVIPTYCLIKVVKAKLQGSTPKETSGASAETRREMENLKGGIVEKEQFRFVLTLLGRRLCWVFSISFIVSDDFA